MIRKWLNRLFRGPELNEPLPEEEKDYMSYSLVDRNTGMLLSVVMVCGCGSPVVRLNEDGKFYCEHCDRGCSERPCQFCEAHFLFDAEALKAEYASEYDEYEDEDEEDW